MGLQLQLFGCYWTAQVRTPHHWIRKPDRMVCRMCGMLFVKELDGVDRRYG